MSKIDKNILAMVIAVVSFISTTIYPITVFAWGDNSEGGKGRPSYTLEEIKGGVLGNRIVFNSISDSEPMGDGVKGGSEKNFVGARECVLRDDGRCEGNSKTNKWCHNDIDVEDGKTYIIRMYIHNNNPNGENAIAENTHVSFSIPADYDQDNKRIQVNGFIDSSNATPSEYWDYVNFNSEVPFHLEYVYGSALLENNNIGLGGLTLSDDIVKAKSGGVMIGYDALDGRVPGCYQYDNFVTIQVKAVFGSAFTVETNARIDDGEDRIWLNSVDAKVGDKVEFRIGYENTSDKSQTDVAIKDILPSNLKYVAGSSVLKNSNHPNGAKIVQDSVVTNGINIGSYGPGANAYIYFTAEVVDENLEQGSNILTNWAQAGVGDVTIQDSVEIRVQNDRKYHMILTAYGVAIVFCLIIIATTIWKTIKRNNLEQVGRRNR